jgi:TRAP-type transport system small permease protein
MAGVKIIDRTLGLLTILSFVGVISVVVIQILSRYLPYTAVWTEELTRFLFIYSIAFAAPLALKKKEFINVELLINLLPKRAREIYEAMIYLVIVLLCSVVAYQGYIFTMIGRGQTSATMALDMSIMHASIGVSMVFIAIYAIFHVIDYLKGLPERSEE